MRGLILLGALGLASCAPADEAATEDAGSATEAIATSEATGFQTKFVMDVGAAPHGIRVEGNRAYIAAAGADAIEVIDLDAREIIDRWPIEGTPLGLTRSANGWLVTAFRGEVMTELVAPDYKPQTTWNVGESPSLFTPDNVGDLTYVVSEFADRFTVFNTATNEIVATYTTGDRPYPADVTKDGVLAFVPNKDAATVTVIDLLNEEVVAETEVCAGPTGGALTMDEEEYLLACGDANQVWSLNTSSFEVIRRLDGVGPRPFSVEVSEDGRWAFANNAGGTTITVIDLDIFRANNFENATGYVVDVTVDAIHEEIDAGEQPIVMRVYGDTLYVGSEVSNTFHAIQIPEAPKPAGTAKSEVVVMGMIHSTHRTSETFSLDVVSNAARRIAPDYWLVEIPPNRLRRAMIDWALHGEIRESRVSVFPEYIDAMFPLTAEMDFEIIATAGWNSHMNRFRNTALGRISDDPARAAEWVEYNAAGAEAGRLRKERGDDPMFIHTAEYDAITKAGLEPYDRLFNDELGTGGWTTINEAHYANIEAALDQHTGEGKRFLITYGAGHKYWILEQLRLRDDIVLMDTREFFESVE